MEQEQYLTVKQFAEQAVVSTQRIYQLLTETLQAITKIENETKYVSIEGLRIFDIEPMQEVANPETELLRETIEALRTQLTVRDEQLAEKDKQIGDLTASLLSSPEQHKDLTAAQALHARIFQRLMYTQNG